MFCLVSWPLLQKTGFHSYSVIDDCNVSLWAEFPALDSVCLCRAGTPEDSIGDLRDYNDGGIPRHPF